MGRAARLKQAKRNEQSTISPVDIGLQRALSALASGNRPAAILALRQHLLVQPEHDLALFHLAVSLRDQGELDEAERVFVKLVALCPTSVPVLVNLAETLRRARKHAEAEHVCDRALSVTPTHAETLVVRSSLRMETGRAGDAEADARAAIAREPTNALAHKLRFQALMALQRGDDALEAYRTGDAAAALDFETHRWAGDQLSMRGLTRDSILAYQRSITGNPHDANVYTNLTALLCKVGLHALALKTADIGIRIDPDLKELHFNRATVFEQLKQYDESLAAFGEVLRCDPLYGEGLVALGRLRGMLCDWEGLEEARRLSCTMTYRRGIATSPFGMLVVASSRTDLLETNKVWAKTFSTKAVPLAAYATPRSTERKQLRIGYLSADFHQHATAVLLIEVLELHDRTRFETFGYSIGSRDDGAMRRRIVTALDTFRDLADLSHDAAAQAIADDDLDILVDLKGYTFQSRPEILARRPAPIQVNYLGYPSTMGARFIDYIIGDATVTPFDHAPYFTEKIVQLPHSYQPNDRKRVSSQKPCRAQFGLPEQGFVFCCFNASYKLTPAVFDIWMRILDQVEGSVFWLYAAGETVQVNLRKEAAARGIAPARLVFAPPMPIDEHLARIALGDLFLDTIPVGAHTTASDALWVGLPVLTIVGEAFAARVGASLLHAVGLPELVTSSLADYERQALRLACDPLALSAIRHRLADALATAPLFDSLRYTRNFEAALTTMVAIRETGDVPRSFAVTEVEAATVEKQRFAVHAEQAHATA